MSTHSTLLTIFELFINYFISNEQIENEENDEENSLQYFHLPLNCIEMSRQLALHTDNV